MISLVFCAVAVALYFIGRRLVKAGSAFRRKGGDVYTKMRRRKTIGQTLWAIAGLLLVLGIFNLFYSNQAPTTNIAASSDFTATAPPPSPAPTERTPTPHAETSTAAPLTPANIAPAPPPKPFLPAANQTITSSRLQELDEEMANANAVVRSDPSSATAYEQRGNIYGQEKKWDLATKDFKHALKIDGNDSRALFDLAQIDFLQGKYDSARAGFVPLQKDSDVGDLASYKVFLCDLAGGHLKAASAELDAFNRVGSNASYYFANVGVVSLSPKARRSPKLVQVRRRHLLAKQSPTLRRQPAGPRLPAQADRGIE